MLIMLIIGCGAAIIGGIGGWLLTRVFRRWYVRVTIPRIARRESSQLDREYYALVRKGHHQRPDRPH